jgi:UDP-3-O-[3-hydroxymyristoyl] glucosamine N-acyltransferase
MLAGQVGIAGHLTIANSTSIGAQSGISKSVTEEGLKLMGSPAIEFGSFFKSYAVFKKLPDIRHRLKDLENKIQTTQNESMSTD